MRIITLACAASLSFALSGAAFAFDASAPDAPGAAPASPIAAGTGDAAVRSARSIECSQKADAQNLHGKPRKHFMRECKHGA